MTGGSMGRMGEWTPWAQVQCVSCADAALVPEPDGERGALCDKCGGLCWVRADVAALQALGRAVAVAGLQGWLEQTGGMCSAWVLPIPGYEIVATYEQDFFLCRFRIPASPDDERWLDPIQWSHAEDCDQAATWAIGSAALAVAEDASWARGEED